MNRKGMEQLVEQLNDASQKYYTLGTSMLSDAQWDALYDELVALEKETGVVLENSPTRNVGAKPLANFAEHIHLSRLWSMEKAKTEAELQAWLQRVQKRYEQSPQPLPPLQYSVELKLDGLTLNLTYAQGQLIQAATRGNGVSGESILPQAKTIANIPKQIPFQGLIEVQGECIMRLSTLALYNKQANEPLKNARNAAAGALRNINPAITASRKLEAIFFQVGTIDNPSYSGSVGMRSFMVDNNFPCVKSYGVVTTLPELLTLIAKIEQERESLDYLIDGVVIKVCDLATRNFLGNTDKFPRWAIAYKFVAEEDITVLRDVTWEVGRTGKLTPLAHVEAVDIGGTTVQKATLNNRGDIQRKGLAIGASVRIRRSNDVIPEILGRVGEKEKTETPIISPTNCPFCLAPLVEKGAHIFCPNSKECKPQLVKKMAHFASREAMDIEGFSEKTAELLFDEKHIHSMVEVYKLTASDWLSLEGFKTKKAQNMMNALQKSKSCSLDAFLFSLGIATVGRKTARDLAVHFGSLLALQHATLQDYMQVDEVGEVVAQSLVDYFSDEETEKWLAELMALGITPTVSKTTGKEQVLLGKTIVVTGTLPTLGRKEAEAMIVAYGGKAGSSVSKNTSYVLAGDKAGSKLAKAESLGVEVITEERFLQMLSSVL